MPSDIKSHFTYKEKLKMRIMILADFTTNKPGGAQIVVENFAKILKKNGMEIFVCNSNDSLSNKSIFEKSYFFREMRSILNPIALATLHQKIKQFRPDVIWVHNINNYWSWSSLLMCKSFAKTILTCHDLSAISNMKLKREVFDSSFQIVFKNLKMSQLTKILLRIKHFYLKSIFKRIIAVAIGEICEQVLVANNFRIITRIPNRVESCEHVDKITREPNSVLFAGRPLEKGLKETAMGVREAGMKLFLIGPEEIYSEAVQYCPISQISYLGMKSNQELLRLLHSYEIVSVCSQYFDNFPTIGLEALAHGCKVVTTEITGLSCLLSKYEVNEIIPSNTVPDFKKIQSMSFDSFNNPELLNEITNPEIVIKSYIKIFSKLIL